MKFVYHGTDARGAKRSGEVVAQSRAEALRKLAVDKIQPLSLSDAGDGGAALAFSTKKAAPSGAIRGKPGIQSEPIYLSFKQLVYFTDEMADFLQSGLQLEAALHLMENREEKSNIKLLSASLREKVRDGTSFSEALRQCSPSFNDLYCNLVKAGEASGALGPILSRQAIHLESLQVLRAQVQMALIYPAFLVGGGTVAMIVFTTFLVPQMVNLLKHNGGAMPLPTYILYLLGNFCQHYGLIVLALLGIGTIGFVSFVRQPYGRLWWDMNKLRIPLLGPLWYVSFYGEFCQTLANLLNNGLPLIDGLRLTSKTTGNVFLNTIVTRLENLVGEGVSLSQAMKTVGQFPPYLRDLVKVGEQTGELGASLEKIGIRYEILIKRQMETIMSFVQPAIVAIMGSVVGLVAWSMLAGIFETMKRMQGHI